jgi:MarR family transcriptional regulator, organic hydroperoxide resistance regulator
VPTEDQVLQFMRLIWAIDHELERVSKRMETSHGLTIAQRMTLLLIGRNPGVSASDLAAQMYVHAGTMSGILKRLESGGFIARTSDARDGRRHVLTLTAAGVAANRQRHGTFESTVRALLRAAAPADVTATERVLSALAGRLRDSGLVNGDPVVNRES